MVHKLAQLPLETNQQFLINVLTYLLTYCIGSEGHTRDPRTNYAARTCLSYQRVPMIGCGRLSEVACSADVDPAYCRAVARALITNS